MSEVLAIICVLGLALPDRWPRRLSGSAGVRDTGTLAPSRSNGLASLRSFRRATKRTTSLQACGSLLRQEYPGSFRVIVVDDDSSDGTAAVATRAAASVPGRQTDRGRQQKVLRPDGPERSGPSSRASPPPKNCSPNISFSPTLTLCTRLTRLPGL